MIKDEITIQQNKVKSMQDYLAPAVREMQPSGIRKFFDLVSSSKEDIISLRCRGTGFLQLLGMFVKRLFIHWNAVERNTRQIQVYLNFVKRLPNYLSYIL